ncbi:MAG: sensor histidine kinase [Nannocystales bacterium]
MPPERSLLRSTLLALLAPRRLLSILVVAVPLVLAQDHYSVEPMAAPLGVLMCLAFFLFAPLSWRALFQGETSRRRTFTEPFGRLVVYGVAGAGTVALVGSVVPDLLGLQPTLMTSESSLLVSIALFLVGGYGLGRDIDLERSLHAERKRADDMTVAAERAQLLALRNHLDPHFLFNTLNAIAEWCREDGEVAERATLQLSEMLRTIMAGTHTPAWSLEQEVALLDTLFALYQIRDPEKFVLQREMDEPLPRVEVPPMLLLPVVENAIKHGPAASHRGAVHLRVHAQPGGLSIEVQNPGAFEGRRPGGEGLRLVEKRLEHAYGTEATFSIEARDDTTLVRLTLPSQPNPEPDPT